MSKQQMDLQMLMKQAQSALDVVSKVQKNNKNNQGDDSEFVGTSGGNEEVTVVLDGSGMLKDIKIQLKEILDVFKDDKGDIHYESAQNLLVSLLMASWNKAADKSMANGDGGDMRAMGDQMQNLLKNFDSGNAKNLLNQLMSGVK